MAGGGATRRQFRGDSVLALAGLAALFALTAFATNRYHVRQRSLAERWYTEGEAQRTAGAAAAAVESFRTALVYSRDNPLYQLRLAQALADAGRLDEAWSYLSSLWERNPENATVNLALGRLAARRNDVAQAMRYYHNALYADWEGHDAGKERRAARLEFYRFLVSRGLKTQAEAELVVMAANLPPDPALYTEAGQLFLGLGDFTRALEQFQEALRLDAQAPAALAGAGKAEFALGGYAGARLHLERATRENPADRASSNLLNRVRLVLDLDPLLPRLSAEERRHRIVMDFRQALRRLAACGIDPADLRATPVSLDELALAYAQALKLRPQIQPARLRRDADLETTAMNLTFEIEETSPKRCGPGTADDQALALIAREHGSTR